MKRSAATPPPAPAVKTSRANPLGGTAARVVAVLAVVFWVLFVALGGVVKPLGAIGWGFGAATALVASYGLLRGGRALSLTSLLLVVVWSICNTYGCIAEPHEKLQTYGFLDAMIAGCVGVLLLKRPQPWRFGVFLMAMIQLVLHTKFAWVWDYSLPARYGYILTLNVTYAFELVALFAGVLVYAPEPDDMPPLPEFVDVGWLECVDNPELGTV